MSKRVGHGAPTKDTPGILGSQYFDIDSGTSYTCTNIIYDNATTRTGEMREERVWTPESGGGSGGVATSPDWNENDPNSPAYIKNRTHYLGPPKFDISWDDNMDGRIALNMTYLGYGEGVYMVYVSDAIPTMEDLYNSHVEIRVIGTHSAVDGGCDLDEYNVSEMSDLGCYSGNDFIVVLYDNNPIKNMLGVEFPLGVYFLHSSINGVYVSNWKGGANEIKKIDEEFLPDAILDRIYNLNEVAFSGDYNHLHNTPIIHEDVLVYKNLDDILRKNTSYRDTFWSNSAIDSLLHILFDGIVPPKAFYGCNLEAISNLTSTLIRMISEFAFYNSSVATVYLPNVSHIRKSAFSNCKNLRSVYIPNIMEIDESAFSGCSKLRALYINSETIVTLGTNALNGTPMSSGEGSI